MKFFLKRLHNKKGFTLIELIVVIAILAILALIAVPRFAGFTAKADVAVNHQYGALIGNAVVTLMAEGTVEVTAAGTPGTISIANDGTFTVSGFTGLSADDSKVTDLVAKKALSGTGTTVSVSVTSDGVVTVTP